MEVKQSFMHFMCIARTGVINHFFFVMLCAFVVQFPSSFFEPRSPKVIKVYEVRKSSC